MVEFNGIEANLARSECSMAFDPYRAGAVDHDLADRRVGAQDVDCAETVAPGGNLPKHIAAFAA
jgi:hypothetical protein